MEETLNDAIDTYNTSTDVETQLPRWFIDTMRSQGTRNITVETWNQLCANVRKLASNGVAVDVLLKTLAEHASGLDEFTDSLNKTIATNASNINSNSKAIEDLTNAKLNRIEPAETPTADVKYVYAADADGKSLLIAAAKSAAEKDSLVLRSSTGRFTVFDPIDSAEPASKNYVDTKAIGKIEYNSSTGILKIMTVNGAVAYTIDFPVEKILKKAALSDDSDNFIFTFADESTIAVPITKLTNPVWISSVKDGGSTPPTTDAVKTYVDTKNTSLDKKVTDIQEDVALLKAASEGNLYKTKHILLKSSGGSAAYTFGNALTHGVWTQTSSWSYSLSLAFDCLNAIDRKNNKVGKTRNSLIFPGTESYYVYIPVKIYAGTTCKFLCDSYNGYGDEIYKYNFRDSSGNQIFTYNLEIGASCKIPDGITAETLVIMKRDPGKFPGESITVENLRLYVDTTSAYRYTYDTQLSSDGYPGTFMIYPSARLLTSSEGSIEEDVAFSYIEKLPEEGV